MNCVNGIEQSVYLFFVLLTQEYGAQTCLCFNTKSMDGKFLGDTLAHSD